MNSYVYVIGVSNSPVKIGSATNVDRRLRSLQIGCPDELKVFFTIWLRGPVAQKVECEAHRRLEGSHRRGEWFDVDFQFAKLIIISSVDYVLGGKVAVITLRSDNFLDGLSEAYDLHPLAKDALNYYHQNEGDPLRQKHLRAMHQEVFDQTGDEGLAVFRIVVVERRDLRTVFARAPSGLPKAEAILARAVNALSGWYASRLKLDKIPKIAA